MRPIHYGVGSAVYLEGAHPFFTVIVRLIQLPLTLDFLCIEEFSTVADMNGEDFIKSFLIEKMNAIGACCGFNFRFGKNASCGAQELKDFFENRGGRVNICDKILSFSFIGRFFPFFY